MTNVDQWSSFNADDSVQCLRFSPPSLPATYLIAGSWDNNVRCWEIKGDGSSEPKSQQSMQVSGVVEISFSSVYSWDKRQSSILGHCLSHLEMCA